MPKRSATTELNHVNWDQADDNVDEIQADVAAASQNELKKRVLITGRRRLLPTDSATTKCEKSNNVFSSFSGFGKRTEAIANDAATKAKHIEDSTTTVNCQFHFIKVNGSSKQTDKLANGIHISNTGAENHKDENSSDKIIFVDVDKDNADSKDAKCSSSSTSTAGVATNFSSCTSFVAGNSILELQSTSSVGSQANEKLSRSMQKHFCKHLKVLNNCVLDWIDKHLKENPYLDLTPVFNDYIKHYKSLTQRFKSSDYNDHKSAPDLAAVPFDQTSSNSFAAQEHANSVLTEVSKTSNLGLSNSTISSIFATKKDTQGQAALSTNGNGSNSTPAAFLNALAKDSEIVHNKKTGCQDSSLSSTSKVQFSAFSLSRSSSDNVIADKTKVDNLPSMSKAAGFSFGFGAQKKEEISLAESAPAQPPSKLLLSFLAPPSSAVSTDNEDDNVAAAGDDNAEYQPPKPDLIQVEEKDAYYSIKCKLFYKADGKFVEKGIGTLHLKKLESGKSQLLIRTDTSLGNILLNVCLSESTPCSRVGKNNVSLACVPNPPIVASVNNSVDRSETKVTPVDEQNSTMVMLIRVKTTEEADVLFKNMNDARKATEGK